MKGLTIFLVIVIMLIGSMALILKPVPIPQEKDCLTIQGIVTEISEGGEHDIIFTLRDESTDFYINRGLERGLDLDKLRSTLINKEITIKYPKYWTPLDPANSIRHVSKLVFQGTTIFTEIN